MKKGILRFLAGTWVVSANNQDYKFRSVIDMISFCNIEKIQIENKGILLDEHKALLEL